MGYKFEDGTKFCVWVYPPRSREERGPRDITLGEPLDANRFDTPQEAHDYLVSKEKELRVIDAKSGSQSIQRLLD